MIYIQRSNGEILELAVTTDITVTLPSDATQHPLEAGSNISDNLVNRNTQFSYNGLVTDVTSYNLSNLISRDLIPSNFANGKPNQKNVQDFFRLLLNIRDARELFTFHFDSDIYGSGVSNCVLKSIDFSRTVQQSNGYLVSFQIEQVRVSERARQFENTIQRNPDQNESSQDGGVAPTQDLPVTGTFGVRAFGGLFGGG